MKTLFLAAAALTIGGSALAYQTGPDPMTATTTTTISIDPTVAITPPVAWTDDERLLWEQHMAATPADWTAAERAMFRSMIALPPVNWTMEQRTLYGEHLAYFPATWTAAQRAAYQQQIASLRTPWVATGTTLAMAPVGDRIIQPSNANPELDARGIRVISDPAVVPDGYNGHAATGMGGPLVDPATGETIDAADDSYPACTATVTDNCIQLYERGVRAESVGGPFEEADEPDPAGTTEDDTTDPDY